VPNGFLPPGFTAYESKRPKFKRDTAAARRLMADAGFAQGFEIDCLVSQEEEQGKKLGLLVQASLKDIGIKVNIVPEPPFAVLTAALSKLETAPAFGVHRLISPLTADPGAFIRQVFGSTNAGKPYNDSWYQNAEVERLLDEAERTANEQKRIELWRKAESIIVDDQPVLFVVFASPIVEPVRARVTNYVYHPLEYSGVFPFYEVSLR
jgi:peptide/nickel transport system substrate-binding protein